MKLPLVKQKLSLELRLVDLMFSYLSCLHIASLSKFSPEDHLQASFVFVV